MKLTKFALLALVVLGLSLLKPWTAVLQAAWSCSTASVVNVQTGVSSSTASLPTNAPANGTKWAFFINRSNSTNIITGVSSTGDAAGWTASANNPQTSGATALFAYYKVGATSGADTITATWDGTINTQSVAGWCDDDASGSAQTFDGEASITTITASTAWVSNTRALSATGGIVGFMGSGSTWASVTPNSGETYASGNAAGVRAFIFTKGSAAGSVGFDVTAGTSSTGKIFVLGFLNPAAAGGGKNRTLLGVGDQ